MTTKNILFTGASSFTGFWFASELAQKGHSISATFQASLESYAGIRRARVDQIINICQPSFQTSFGSDLFFKLLDEKASWDIFCHHAADVTNYKSVDFNVVNAIEKNTQNIKKVFQKLKEKGCKKIVLTGSVFEQNEGMGSGNLPAFSPYGLSKGLTSDIFKYFASIFKIPLVKFVIPNPFGPFEEIRFTSSLIQTWKDAKVAQVNSPSYVRDNIHVSLLAKAYAHFILQENNNLPFTKFNPSGYPESQGAFTARFAEEMKKRLHLTCEYHLHEQIEFLEPKVRINYDHINPKEVGWDERKAWDTLADYYQTHFLETSTIPNK